jgi:hypothetical protein
MQRWHVPQPQHYLDITQRMGANVSFFLLVWRAGGVALSSPFDFSLLVCRVPSLA